MPKPFTAARQSLRSVQAVSDKLADDVALFGSPNPAPYLAETLDHLTLLAEAVETAQRELVALLRDRGASWATIGAALNTTRQGAQQRYGG